MFFFRHSVLAYYLTFVHALLVTFDKSAFSVLFCLLNQVLLKSCNN